MLIDRKGMDWTKGIYQPQISVSSDAFQITLASDWAPIWEYETLIHEKPLAVYGDLLSLFQKSDLNIVNVECVLGDEGEPIPKGGPHLRGSAETVKSLTEVPFHIACLANNHTLDYGKEGLARTLEILKKEGVRTVGAGLTGEESAKPLILDHKATKIAILNCAEGEACCSLKNRAGSNGFNVPSLEKQIRNLKKNVDVVIVIFHGGREYVPLPPPYVVEGLRRLAEAGASAVIGHHPHVPQGIEIHDGVPIVYSQGNFVFRRGDAETYTNMGYLVHLDFEKVNLARMSLTPYRMESAGVFRLKGEEKAAFLYDLKEVSDLLANADAIHEVWDAVGDASGEEGLLNLFEVNLKLYKENPVRASARFHNLFFTPAHRDFYLNGFMRLSRGELGNAPEWAKKLVRKWRMRAVVKP